MAKMKYSGEVPEPNDNAPFKKGFLGGMGWGAFLLFCTIGGVAWWWGRKRRMEIEASRRKVTSSGDARIGGLWSLVDHEGRPQTSSDFKGQYTLIYFGFTYCPDICPEELKKMARALNMLPEAAQTQITPLMISVDPWRDSIAQLAGYVKEFHPKMIGLVGTPQQVDHITRAFRVYTSKGPEETEGDYLMDHSIFMYLMDKEGKFLDYYGVAMDAEEIAESIQNHLAERHDIAEPGFLGALKFWWYHREAKASK
jgi:protein SCO1/2